MNSRVYGLSFPKKVSLCTYWTEEEWFYVVVVVESLSCIWLFATPWTAVHQASLSFTSPEVCWNSCYWVGDAIQTSHPLWPLLLLPSIFPNIRVFPSESDLCIRWPTYWASASASLLPMNIQGWFPLGLNGLSSLLFKELSRVFSSTTVQRHQFFSAQWWRIMISSHIIIF